MSIPKIIHNLWLDGKYPKPERIMRTWKEKNPSCLYLEWTSHILKYHTFKNQEQIDMMPELNGKCDIMRYEILKKLGGIFVDADMECVNPLDDEIFSHKRITCYESETNGMDLLSCAFMGCDENDPIMGLLVLGIGQIKSFDDNPAWVTVGPRYFTDMVRKWEASFPINIYPSKDFLAREGKPKYALHYGGTTYDSYEKLK
jgi:mannosyltransferase OCH1-like enzyme